MPAKHGNKNAQKEGFSFLVRVRLEVPDDMIRETIIAMSPEERGAVLAAHVGKLASDSLVVVADCSRCGDAINATEPIAYWDGQRICGSCLDIALSRE